MQTYKEWMIEKYLGKNTPRGDLAYDIKRDKDFPNGQLTKQRMLDHLDLKRACDKCIATFKRIWKDYCKETGFQE